MLLLPCRCEQAAKELSAQTTQHHLLEVEIVECPCYDPGRPKKGVPKTPTRIEYQLVAKIDGQEEAIARCRQMIGCFVLLTSVPDEDKKDEGYSAEMILRTYKDQHGIENNLGFSKMIKSSMRSF